VIWAALILAAPQEAPAWPTYHGGYSLDGAAATAPPDAPVRLWRFTAGERIEATPVSAGGRLFVAGEKGGLWALDLSGKELWKGGLKGDTFASPPMAADGAVVAGSADGTLWAFEAATGRERWRYAMGDAMQGSANRVALPGGVVGTIAISQADGSIHCVDLATGKLAWKTGAIERCDGTAGVGDGWVAMGSCAAALHVFSVDKGEKRADIELGEEGQVAGGVAVAGTVAYAGTRSGALCAVDVAAGKLLWSNTDGTREAFATPAVGERAVVFASDDGKFTALARATGVKLWEFDAGAKPVSPVIAGGRVVACAGGTLRLLDLETGRMIWEERISDRITSPALVGGTILVGADDGTVSAYGKK
jgi:outer membrane protein assembly factor BamB